jgi:uncharacterized protein (TIGR01777 family)
MKLLMTGATGLIGSILLKQLREKSHSISLLSRNPPRRGDEIGMWHHWQPGQLGEWQRLVDGADGIINLAGEPIAETRWSKAQKEKLRNSRIDGTRSLVAAIARARVKPKFLINASAAGFYGSHGDEKLNEASKPGDDFLSALCVEWEAEAKKAEEFGVRVVLLRTAIVLAKGRGALAKMVLPFKFFAGGPLGSGAQWVPWIHIEDEVGLLQFLIDSPDSSGPFNATTPNAVTMAEFARALGDVLNRPSWFAVPPSMLALAVGEMADMLLAGQRALPDAAMKQGYDFKFPEIKPALRSLNL